METLGSWISSASLESECVGPLSIGGARDRSGPIDRKRAGPIDQKMEAPRRARASDK